MYRVPQFLEKCGNISDVNCQPVEKNNHRQSWMFHHGTSKGSRNSRYTIQVMEKENGKLSARVYKFHRTKKLDDDQGSIATHTPTIRKKDKGNVKH